MTFIKYLYLNDAGEEYKEDYKYCQLCGKSLESGNVDPERYDRYTGARLSGPRYIGCEIFSDKNTSSTRSTLGHDMWIETELAF